MTTGSAFASPAVAEGVAEGVIGRAVDDQEELAGPAVDDGVAEGVVGPAVGLGPVGSKYEALHARQQFRTVPLATSQIGFNTAHWTSLQFFLPDVLLVFPTR